MLQNKVVLPWLKLIIAFGLTGIIILALTTVQSWANNDATIRIIFNEQELKLSQAPIIADGSTLVPFRPLFEAMGLTVKWDPSNRTVTAQTEEYSLFMQIDNPKATVNGQELKLNVAPTIVNGNALVPIRFISESTGSLVAWNAYGRQVIVYTEDFILENGQTKESVQKLLNDELARIKAEYEAGQTVNPPDQTIEPVTVPPVATGSGVYRPASSDTPALNKLQGMYYGFRPDYSGYDCGGMCWDLYTFLPNQQVVIGLPKQGGPETIDCAIDECHSYTIKDGTMKLGNQSQYDIKVTNGMLSIDDVELEPVRPASQSLTLDHNYTHRGFFGLSGISAGSTSWTYQLALYQNGTFKSSHLMLGSIGSGIGPRTNSSASGDSTGSYRISGNTLVLAYGNGKVAHHLFFIHNDADPAIIDNIQISDMYYTIED